MSRILLTAFAALLLCTALGCGDDRLVKTLPPGFREDVFAQEAASRIDVLWVIDDSASMGPHQDRLAASLKRFMDLFSRGRVDYRIAVTTTDVFKDKEGFSTPIIDPNRANPGAEFESAVRVGTEGKGHERAFEAAQLAIDREKARAAEVLADRRACTDRCPGSGGAADTCRGACAEKHEPEFMRPESHLYVVFVSDEEEQSFGEVRYFQRYFESALGVGNEGAVTVAAICGDVAAPSCEAQHGARYVALAEATGGFVGSICDDNFDRHLERIALDAAGLKRKFGLSKRPDLETLSLAVLYRCDTPDAALGHCASLTRACEDRGPEHQGLSCVPPQGEANGWTFEPGTNSLLFHGDSVPALRSALVVSYQAEDRR